MTREEELKAQQDFIATGKATIMPEFTSHDVAIMLHKRRIKHLAKMPKRYLKHLLRLVNP